MSRQSRSLLKWRRVSRKVSIDTPSSVIREPPPVYLTGIPKVHREITRGRARCRRGFELAQAIPAHLAWKRRFALRRISGTRKKELRKSFLEAQKVQTADQTLTHASSEACPGLSQCVSKTQYPSAQPPEYWGCQLGIVEQA